MSEKNSSTPENKKKTPTTAKRKVSTGAWWKSTLVEEVEPLAPLTPGDTGTATDEPDKTTEQEGRESRQKQAAKKRRGKPRPAATDEQADVPAESETEQAANAAGSAAPEAAPKEDKPSSRRKRGRPRKKSASRKDAEAPPADDTGAERQETASVPQAEESGAEVPPDEEQEAAFAEPDRQDSGDEDGPEPSGQEDSRRQTGAGRERSGRGRQNKGEQSQAREKKETPEHKPVIKLLINAEEPEECRLALLEDGRLESIHVATSTRTQTKNNIYKAKIVAIEPNLQAAFVDYGTEKNGFLPFSEIHPEYYKQNVPDKIQQLIDQHQWKKLSITDVMERGREVLVQVVKEEVGKKGANMTTYLSLPGRCVVLMPGSDSTGISRKIVGEEKRTQLRDHMLGMNIPEGIGWIVRTASMDITKTALGRDVSYLLKLWDEVKRKGQELEGVGLIYQDHDHVLRFLREHFDPDIQEILVDDEDALEQVKGFIELLPAKQRKVRCKLHRGARPIFNQYSIEDQIESIYQPHVNLPSGGSIVIDPTEALVAIDVNSGSTQKGKNFEDTIFQANMEAATELARQLRLRDLGGLIVVDFIDMRSKKNTREVEKQVKTAMKRDKAKVDISRISKFGLMQISRQKLGAPIEAGNYRVCSCCKGRGVVRSVETLALFYLRRIHTAASRKQVRQIECRFPLDVAGYLLNNKRNELRELELKYDTEVVIKAEPSFDPGDHDIIYHKGEKTEK